MSRDQIIAIIYRVADEYRIPRLLLLACAIAEGNLNPLARRPSDPRQDRAFWPDVSGSTFQQAVRWDPDYRGGDAYPGDAEVDRILTLQLDHERSARVAAANLSRKFRDGTETDDDENLIRDLFEYNWPAGKERPFTPAHEANYRRGLREARVILGATPMSNVTTILNRVIELGRAEIGKPYAGPVIGQPDSYRYGDPGYDCSSFVSELYKRATGGAIKLTAYTDAAIGQCDWVQQPQAGDLVFYNYVDPSQGGVTWPHMGIWLSPTETLDCRYPEGVGVHPHVTPVGPDARGRFRKTMRPKGLALVALPDPVEPTPGPDLRDAEIVRLNAELAEARTHLGVITVNYMADLENILNAIRALKPAA